MSWRSSVAIAMADLAIAGQARQPGAQLLDRLELGGPGRHLLVVLGVLDRDRRLRRERRHRVELVVGPGVRRVVVDVEQAEDARVRRRAAPCRSCRSPPGRPRPGRPRRAGRRCSRRRTAAGGRRRPATAATGPGTRCTRLEVGLRQAAADLGDGRAVRVRAGRPPPRSASKRTIAWSTRPDRIRSRSSRLPMSPATRRSASARWSWWRTVLRLARPRRRPTRRRRPRGRGASGSSAAGSTPGPASMTSTPHGPSEPGIATAVSGRPPMTDRTSLDVIGRGRASCRAVSSTMPSSPGRRPCRHSPGRARRRSRRSRAAARRAASSRGRSWRRGGASSPRSSNTATARCGPWSRIAVAASDRATATVAADGGDPGQLDEQASIGVLAAGVDRLGLRRGRRSGDAEGLAGGALAASDGRQQLEPRPAVAAP